MSAANNTETVSFIIPHKGRFDMLKETLRSITEQNYPKDKIEVVVVSQTPEITASQELKIPSLDLKVEIIPTTETISTQRNRGVALSSGNYIAFLDADIFIAPNWTDTMLKHLDRADSAAIISGTQACETSAPVLERIRTYLVSAETDTEVGFLPGCNLFLKRSTFNNIGGFPEHLITCEDYYFTDKAKEFGSLYRTADATYIHLGEDKSFAELYKKEMWRGQSNFKSIKGRRLSLHEVPSILLPPAIFIALLSTFVFLLFRHYALAIGALLIAIAPVIAYSLRLKKLSSSAISFHYAFAFYATYFTARAIGTAIAAFKSIGANHH